MANHQHGPDRLTARTKWRMRAVEILYEAESRDLEPSKVLAERASRAFADPEAPRLPAYSEELVRGVAQHLDELDAIIGASAKGWSVERIAAVDRNVMRVALYEIRHVPDVDTPVAIKEAMRVALQIGSSDDTSFVNGVLDKAAKADKPRARVEAASAEDPEKSEDAESAEDPEKSEGLEQSEDVEKSEDKAE